jgi:plastocyanin
MKTATHLFGILTLLLFAVTACGGDGAPGDPSGATDAPAAASVPLTGDVIEVKMISDLARGELFEPADFTANRGDIVRFVLVTGVHNANFFADRNPPGVKLPEVSPYLQVPGQTWEFVVEQPAGEYPYQCDPHVALGMVGTMTVVD